VTPLNAVLQAEAEPEARAQYIAASNVVDAFFIVLSAAVVAALVQGLGLTPDAVLTVLTLSGFPMAFLVARFAPGTRLGTIALSLWPRGPV
ncbi:MAG: hypothetical protein AAFQ88_07520, partial [Pseudomonadota bacterium]